MNHHDTLNRIKFTVEWEKGMKLSFLDCTIDRSTRQLKTSVYHKPTDSGRHINYKSCQPISHKAGTIDCLARRAHQVSSDFPSLLAEKSTLYDNLSSNGYPKRLIESKMIVIRAKKRPREKPNISISLPYYPNLTQKMSRFLAKFGVETFPENGITLGHLLYKNSPECAPKDVIYKVPCENCDSCYVGKTTRHLNYRISEHKRDVKNKKKENAISKHVEKTGHSISWNDVKPISRTRNGKYLSAKENLLITTTDRTVNLPECKPHPAFLGIL